MANQFKSILDRADEYIHKAGKKKLFLIGFCATFIILAGIVGTVLLNKVDYTVLYSGLTAEEAGSIKGVLDDMGVSSKLDGTSTILVPEKNADEIRIELAAEGYPNTGLNYDIFSNSSDLGSTDLERQTYLQYQLQENMRTTIRQMNKVQDCVVIVNLANTSSFVLSSNTTDASVAVMVKLKDGEVLTNAEAKTIGEFVAKCVPNLKYENISLVDSNMNSYDILSGDNDSDNNAYDTTQQELTERMKQILSDQVVSVLEPAIGNNNLAVSVNVNLNFDKESSSQVQFSSPLEDGDQGIVRSSEVLKDLVTNGSGDAAAGEAGTDSNGVSASEYVSNADAGNRISESSSETYNYEINEIRTDLEKAQGTVKNLSVSVLINSNIEGIDEYHDQILNLVANAIGVDPEYISVELMPFVQNPGEMGFDDYLAQNEQTLEQLNRNRLIRAGIIAGAIILAAVILLLAFRRRRKKTPDSDTESEVNPAKSAGGVAAPDTDTSGAAVDAEHMIDGLIMKKSNEIEVIEELMNKYPETVVQILRTWLAEDS
ncbi:MAG: flagellar basal-body MS-ring/collar protein FliF [Oscillospiraceae bacterium]